MKIYIEYDGVKVKCSIENTFSNKPHRIVAFNDADKMSQIFALGSFRNIEQTYKRKQKKMTVNEYNVVTSQLLVLFDLLPSYGGKTLENIITMLQARIKEYNKNRKEALE